MSVVMNIVCYGGGDLLRECFNAIVMALGDTAFASLLKLSIMTAGVAALLQATAKHNPMASVHWLCGYLLFTNILLVPKVSIAITDRLQQEKVYFVDHVPFGVAALASLTSIVGDGLTQLMEKNFSLPDDLTYSRSGMVMASRLLQQTSQFQITDPIFSASLQSYVQQCVFYDLLLHRYDYSELLLAPDLWVFLKGHSSKARAFLYNNEVIVCDQGAHKLDRDWANARDAAALRYGTQIFKNERNAKATLLQYLQSGYSFLTDQSIQGAAILQQQLLANAIQEGIPQFGARVNAPAALASYAYTKAQAQKRLGNQTIGQMAAYWLPLLKNTFECLLYGSFVIVVLLVLFPSGQMILRHYALSLLWIQLWAPLYAILNLVISFYAKNQSAAYSRHGVALIALGGLQQVSADMVGLAGYLSLSIPVFAWGLLQGIGGALSQLSQYVGGTVQSAVASTAAEASSGNISLGNLQLANHSLFNSSAHHLDHNLRYSRGMETVQTPSGSNISVTPNGMEVMDNRGTLSQLGVSINMADSLRASAVEQAQTSYTASHQQAEAASQHYTTALRQILDLGQHSAHSKQSGQTHSLSESSGTSRSAQEVLHLVQNYAKEAHLSEEVATSKMAQVYANAKLGGSFASFVSGDVGTSANVSHSQRDAKGQSYQEAQRYAKDHHFSETIDRAQREAREQSFRTSEDQGSRLAKSIASSFDKADGYRLDAIQSYQKAESYSHLASISEDNSATVNANYTQAFYHWIKEQPSPHGQGRMSHSAIENMVAHDPGLLQSYANRYIHEETQHSMANIRGEVNTSGQVLKNSPLAKAGHSDAFEKIERQARNNEKNISNSPKAYGMEYQSYNVEKIVDHALNDNKEKLNYKNENIVEKERDFHLPKGDLLK